ncbi:MAG: hypothetical protein L3J36_02375 [Rhodobacteraceae bacterium]|nr:hypothetical protein [Paracoccaceae bacterium]
MVLLRVVPTFLVLTVLMGCGADGEPITPTLNAGVAITPNGISPRLGVGFNQGPFSILFGL